MLGAPSWVAKSPSKRAQLMFPWTDLGVAEGILCEGG